MGFLGGVAWAMLLARVSQVDAFILSFLSEVSELFLAIPLVILVLIH
jgi:poly(A) polymerase Pap1